ncbi:deoxyribose-phosphate aldolase-like [Hydractinia symbiolongicarpus]|uniref:deoxyribose-phosphate aldolase-like n=1 Tax=Hydractinia symbiolongicarpus TaxID=13093 RepID=UPI00254A74B5|nr:deoxyribose-phosphate aldolase-like [Hydractinia symbiolongicarpus]
MAAHLEQRNPGVSFDSSWFAEIKINFSGVKARAETIGKRRSIKKEWQAAWLLRAVSCMDLTTLSGDDSTSNVRRLCFKAQNPVRSDLVDKLGVGHLNITCGAVCVYPSRIPDAKKALSDANSKVPIASVAAGFPAGQTPMPIRLLEIKDAVSNGAKEIDIVLSRAHVLQGNWEQVYNEVKEARQACGDAHLKTILATGDCGSLENVYRASMVSMMAGSDFIKTSTGKEGVNAILPVALVMVRCIREYFEKTGHKVGFKPAGGIRSAKDALVWLALMKEELGDEWTFPNLFRIGASSLLVDIERQLYHHCYGRYAAGHEFPIS